MRQGGIEPPTNRWQRSILPLNYQRNFFVNYEKAVPTGIEPVTCRLTAECAAAAPRNPVVIAFLQFVERGYGGRRCLDISLITFRNDKNIINIQVNYNSLLLSCNQCYISYTSVSYHPCNKSLTSQLNWQSVCFTRIMSRVRFTQKSSPTFLIFFFILLYAFVIYRMHVLKQKEYHLVLYQIYIMND